MAPSTNTPPPASILILGSGVFGLSTAYSLTQHPHFSTTRITLLDRLPFPAPDAASIDASRIIRADYADIAYAGLAFEAQQRWRSNWLDEPLDAKTGEGSYHETGLALVVTEREAAEAAKAAGDGAAAGALHEGVGRQYMRKSFENVQAMGLKAGRREAGADVEELTSAADIERIFESLGARADGDFGYVNWRSGWADAEGGMRALRKKVEATQRVDFVSGTVARLHFSATAVTGAELADGTVLSADLIVLATGAWTSALIDLRGVASATGQVLAYLPISSAEQAALQKNPTILNPVSGMFIIPPQDRMLKVARHGYGYANPVRIPHPERPGEEITVSLPRTKVSDPTLQVPREGQEACRDYLAATLPCMAGREFTNTRICWYSDTASGDWLLSYHPKYENLFVATGGSGHAYKFLPVVGDKIVDCLLGDTPEQFKEKWQWPKERALEDQVWTKDWRGGPKGMVLDEELAKGQ